MQSTWIIFCPHNAFKNVSFQEEYTRVHIYFHIFFTIAEFDKNINEKKKKSSRELVLNIGGNARLH